MRGNEIAHPMFRNRKPSIMRFDIVNVTCLNNHKSMINFPRFHESVGFIGDVECFAIPTSAAIAANVALTRSGATKSRFARSADLNPAPSGERFRGRTVHH